MFGGLVEKGRKLQLADINFAVTGSRGTIATPSPGVYAVGAIYYWWCDRKSANPPNIHCNSPPIFPAIQYIILHVHMHNNYYTDTYMYIHA